MEKRITPDDVARRVRRLMTEDRSPPVLVLGGGGTSTTPGRDAGFRNPMTSPGDVIQGGTGGAATRAGIGTTGQVWTVVAGKGAWATPAGGTGATRDLLTNGDVTNPELVFADGDVIWIEA